MCNGFDPGPSTLTDSVIKNNVSTAIAQGGRADVFGAGIITASSLTMREVVISGNRGFAHGETAARCKAVESGTVRSTFRSSTDCTAT